MTQDEFYDYIRNYLNKDGIVLAKSTAAKYKGLTPEVPNKIEVYVNSDFHMIKNKNIKVIKLSKKSFITLQFDIDDNGIRCSTEQQIIFDILKRSYRFFKKYGIYCANYSDFRIIDNYAFKYAKKIFNTLNIPKRYNNILKMYLKEIGEYKVIE